MARRSAIFGFPIRSNYEFRQNGKKTQLGPRGVRAMSILAILLDEASDSDDNAWLLPHRRHVRKIEQLNPRSALTLVIDRTNNQQLRTLAVWLRGRCGGTLGSTAVSRYATVPDRTLRKETTRCLKRLEAWAQLSHIEQTDPDPQIRQLAIQSPPKPFSKRLARFSNHIPRRKVSRFTPPLFESPNLDLAQGRPPKPPWLIRRILERIHRLLAGSAH